MQKINETLLNRDNLIAEYLLDGNANDTSGNGNNGTATNVTWVSGEKGYTEEVGSFNGSDSQINTNADLLSNRTNLTVVHWVKWNGLGNLVGTDSGTRFMNDGWVEHLINTSTGNAEVSIYDGVGNENLNSGIDITDGEWHMLELNISPAGRELYVDNILRASNTTNRPTGNRGANTLIGKRQATTNFRWLNGNVGIVRVYDKVFTKNERDANYKEGLRKLGPSNAPLSQDFPFYSLPNLEEGKVLEISRPNVSGTYYDQTGNGNNGTNNGVVDSNVGLYNKMTFDGTDDIDISHDTTLNGGSSFTVNHICSGTTASRILYAKRDNADTDFFEYGIDNSGALFGRVDSSVGNVFVTSSVFPPSGIYHFTMTYNGSNIKLYLNGQEIGSASQTGTCNNTTTVTLGSRGNYVGSTNPWIGDIYVSEFYQRALSPKEMQEKFYSSKII